MEKTLATLLVTLVVSVMGIPVAYLMGQRSAQESLHGHYREELDRTRAEQNELIASMRSELTAQSREQARTEQATREALSNAGIRVPGPAAQPIADDETEPAAPPIPEETFAEATLGSRYEDIVARFGRDGAPVLTLADQSGTVTTQYVWDWLETDGTRGRIHMEFVDGLLSDKTFKD
jgi:hypothetical protein